MTVEPQIQINMLLKNDNLKIFFTINRPSPRITAI